MIILNLQSNISYMNIYCICCKKNTKCTRRKIVNTKNNRLIFNSVCNVCKKNKSRFYKGGSIDIHSEILPLLPKKGLTLPGYSYCGPGNPLNNGKPVNEFNAICESMIIVIQNQMVIKMIVIK